MINTITITIWIEAQESFIDGKNKGTIKAKMGLLMNYPRDADQFEYT
jgi:hypothetical protein